MKDTAKAVEYCSRALALREEIKDIYGLAESYNFFATHSLNTENIKEAIEFALKALNLQEKMDDKPGLVDSYLTLGKAYRKNNEQQKAVQAIQKAIEIATPIGIKRQIIEANKELARSYYKLHKFKEAYDYFNIYANLKDSILSENTQKQIAEMQTKYETEKKEADIKLLNADKALQEKEIRQQRMVIIGFVVGFVLILIFSIIIYKQYRDKRRANILLAQQKEEISMQRDEIEKQKEIAEHQRDEITEQKREIDDSIRYAKRIQNAVMPLAENISKYVSEIFIMFKPKDVVSGDFYFVKHIETSNVVVIAASDCTGHGVPGAFMSMLGLTFMNEICTKPEVQHSGEVLNLLRTYIINSLHQTGKTGEQKDGMDISLIVIYPDKKKIEFSGANNPLFLIRNDELIEYKGDRMPVGIHDKMDTSFTTNEISYHENDRFYMFSDGFADQFGGPKAKKFLYKNFKQLLLSHHTESMVEQKNIYEKTSVEWRGNIEQIDDQLIIGVKM